MNNVVADMDTSGKQYMRIGKKDWWKRAVRSYFGAMKTRKLLIVVICAALLAIQGCGGQDDPKVCPDASCDDYTTQEQAQTAYDADPECLGELDNDNDRVVCEHLPAGSTGGSTGGTGCPTTANCGCSGRNKDSCASACCKWVVGDGCRCR